MGRSLDLDRGAHRPDDDHLYRCRHTRGECERLLLLLLERKEAGLRLLLHHLGALQLEIMQYLWEHPEGTVADVHAYLLPEKGLAFTTIATMLKKMEEKEIVTHRVEGRKFIYRATIAEGDVRKSMVSDLNDRLFEGNVPAFVSHLLDQTDLDAGDLDEIRSLLEARSGTSAGEPNAD